MATTTQIVSSDLVEQFQRDGFVVVPDLFTTEELERFGAAVDAAVEQDRLEEREWSQKRTERGRDSFLQCTNLWTRYPDVLPWTCHPRLAQAAGELLRVDSVRLWHDQALYKQPGGRRTDPHQDHPYWPIEEADQVTAWVPFEGSTMTGGAMAYYPGSHRVGLARFVDIFGEVDPDDIGEDPALQGTDPVHVEVPRGGVAFHHGLTAHFAEPNATERARRVHTVIYFADGCHRSATGRHPAVDQDSIEPGELIQGPITPVVWPRSEGATPITPPAV